MPGVEGAGATGDADHAGAAVDPELPGAAAAQVEVPACREETVGDHPAIIAGAAGGSGPHLEREGVGVEAGVGGRLDVLGGAVEADRGSGVVEERAGLSEGGVVGVGAVVGGELVGGDGAAGFA